MGRLRAGTADWGRRIEPLIADLQTDEGIAKVIQRVEALGGIELPVNNPGIATAGDFLRGQTQIKFSRVLDGSSGT
jgi:short-subunit dehydrogenase